MTAQAIRWDTWDLAEQADRRFRRVLVRVGIPFLIFAIAVPFLKLAGLERGGGELDGKRYVELLASPPAPVAEQVEEPAPAKEEEKPAPESKARPVPKKETKPEVTQEQRVEQARAKAAKALSWTSQISGLAESRVTPNTSSPLLTAKAGTGTGKGEASTIARSAATTSGGIGETGTVQRSESGTGIGSRRTTTVESPVGASADRGRPGQGGDKYIPGRTLEELQLVFDRNKAAFYAIYNRALRQNPNLRGKIVLSLTIAPNGTVTDCRVVASEMNDPDLEKKIVQRVLLLNFGAKDVPPLTYPNYPLVFFPI